MGGALGWLSGYSEPELRAALRTAAPELADLPIVLHGEPDLRNPLWASCSATVGGHTFAKFALSEETAIRLWREAQALALLHDRGLPVPELVAAGRNPAFSSTTRIAGGAPLAYEVVAAAAPGRIDQLAFQLASFLARLHDAPFAQLDDLPRLPQPGLHLSTEDLRARFTTLLDAPQRSSVRRWCDWVDEQLASDAATVFVHGDFHAYNQLWDLDEPRLLAVLDFETSGLAEPEFDFRVLPVFGPRVDLLLSTVEHYEAMSARKLSLPRIMALHLLNHLGDSLWRIEAGIPAPGGSPSEYVATAADRLSALGMEP